MAASAASRESVMQIFTPPLRRCRSKQHMTALTPPVDVPMASAPTVAAMDEEPAIAAKSEEVLVSGVKKHRGERWGQDWRQGEVNLPPLDESKLGKKTLGFSRFVLKLEKLNATSLGLQLDEGKQTEGKHDKVFLEVTRIFDDGLVTAWNKANSEHQVLLHDCIVKVNSVRKNCDAMIEEITKSQTLHLSLERPATKQMTVAIAKSEPTEQISVASGKSFNEATRESEALAKAYVEASDFSMQALLATLRAGQLPVNTSRKNVMPEGTDSIRGMLVGLYSYGGTLGVSLSARNNPWLTKLLVGAMHAVDPEFPFTSIQVNYGYASRPHVDKNNVGTSYIIGLGDYTDGGLWVHDDNGDVPYAIEGESISPLYCHGRELMGTELDIRHTWRIFDGNRLHFTKTFVGERFSLIFFTCDRYPAADAEVRSGLVHSGFNFDWSNTNLQATLEAKYDARAELNRLVSDERREEERLRLLERGRCIGRVWASGWGLRCTAVCEEGSEFCGSHLQKERWKTHGRIDSLESLPVAKKEEMMQTQLRNIKQGKFPPVIHGATILVDLPPEALMSISVK